MAESRQRSEWNQTSLLAALIANAHRDTKRRSKPFDEYDFHPLLKRPKKRKKSFDEWLAVLATIDPRPAETVTETTWATK